MYVVPFQGDCQYFNKRKSALFRAQYVGILNRDEQCLCDYCINHMVCVLSHFIASRSNLENEIEREREKVRELKLMGGQNEHYHKNNNHNCSNLLNLIY